MYLSSLTSSAHKRRTNALAKNMRHCFLARDVKKEYGVSLFVFIVSGGSGTRSMKACTCEKTFPFSEHVILLPLFELKVIFCNN